MLLGISSRGCLLPLAPPRERFWLSPRVCVLEILELKGEKTREMICLQGESDSENKNSIWLWEGGIKLMLGKTKQEGLTGGNRRRMCMNFTGISCKRGMRLYTVLILLKSFTSWNLVAEWPLAGTWLQLAPPGKQRAIGDMQLGILSISNRAE